MDNQTWGKSNDWHGNRCMRKYGDYCCTCGLTKPKLVPPNQMGLAQAMSVAESHKVRKASTPMALALIALLAEIWRLRAALAGAKRSHYYCEDSWYSCPKAEDGCANESAGTDCDCGADSFNAGIDALLRP